MQKCPVFSPMPLGRSHEFDGAVAMEVVVPSDKGRDPFPGFFQGVEGPFHRIFRMVLQSFEEGLRIGIVITDRRTSERGPNAQSLERSEHCGPLHRRAVVRVQDNPGGEASFCLPKNGLSKRFRRMPGGLFVVDLPPHDFPAVEIQEEIQIEKSPLDRVWKQA